jgi:hypothetical protein
MATIDLKRTYREHYAAPADPVVVEVPERGFLMIDGVGDPNTSPEYAAAVAALYPIAYGLRAAVQDATGDAYTVMPLEGLWWADDMANFSVERKGDWRWTMMICVPDVVTAEVFDAVRPEVVAKKRLTAGDRVRLEPFHEGLAAQVMHRGPYATEAPTIDKLHAFIAEAGHQLRGLHHEIYLTDPRRVDPERNRTIIRQPIR